MGGILSLLSSLGGVGGQSNPVGSLGAPQRGVQPTQDDSSTTGSWDQTRGHKQSDDDN